MGCRGAYGFFLRVPSSRFVAGEDQDVSVEVFHVELVDAFLPNHRKRLRENVRAPADKLAMELTEAVGLVQRKEDDGRVRWSRENAVQVENKAESASLHFGD